MSITAKKKTSKIQTPKTKESETAPVFGEQAQPSGGFEVTNDTTIEATAHLRSSSKTGRGKSCVVKDLNGNEHPQSTSVQNNDEVSKLVQGLKFPFQYGQMHGQHWVKTASVEAIHEAATRLTSTQQLRKYLEYYNQRYAEGSEDPTEDSPMVFYPTFAPEETHSEIYDFFTKIRDEHFYFEDYTFDPSDRSVFADNGYFFYSEIPNFPFRTFENGWTHSVRNYYKNLLLNHGKNTDC